MTATAAMDPLSTGQALATVTRVLEEVRAQGATAAEVELARSAGLSVTVRLGELETLQHNRDKTLRVTAYDGGRKGSASTSDLAPAALERTVEAALAIARYGGEDRHAGLVEPGSLASLIPELDLYHPWELAAEDAIAIATECESAARAVDARIANSEGATLRTGSGLHAYGNTHGFLGGWRSSLHRLTCAVIAKEGDGMQQDYSYTVSRRPAELVAPREVGRQAGERALRRLGARKVATGAVPVLFEARVATSLIGHFISAISGVSLYRRTSFLLDHLGRPIFPAWMRIEERPFLPRALGSRPFDDDGVSPQPRALVDAGVLCSYVLGGYAARRLGMETTGNAGGVSNIMVSHGGQGLADLLKQMHSGFFVTELMGFGVNGVTGDYSRGAAGFWVENAEIQYPVEEVTIAGNLKDMYRSIAAVGSDVDLRHNIRTGSVLIERMTVAGK